MQIKKRNFPFITMLLFISCGLFLFITTVEAGGRFSARGTRQNSAGGITSSKTSGFKSAGGGILRGRTVATDGQGNAAAGSASTFKGPGGRAGIRASETTRTSDGNVQHSGGVAVTGSQGTLESQSGFSKSADGTVSGERNTNVNTKAGGSYQGNTTYNSQTGVTHTGTCTDASGNVVACPSR